MAVDAMRMANWQRSKDGQKNRNRPKPVSPLARNAGRRYGRTTMTPAQAVAYLDSLKRPKEVVDDG